MKTRVLSIRVPYNIIAYCFQLQEQAGKIPRGEAVSTVITNVLTGMVESTRKWYNIPTLDTTEQAQEILSLYIEGDLPGLDFEPVNMKDALKVPVVSLRSTKPAEREEPRRPAEPSAQIEPATEIQPATEEQEPVVMVEKFAEHPVSADAPGCAEMVAEGPSVEDVIEKAAEGELEKDERALLEAVSIGQVERATPDIGTIPKCPWLIVDAVDEDELKDDPVYKEAVGIDPLMELAVRVVYKVIPVSERGKDKAIRLVKQTFRQYKEWRERYGQHS